MPDIIEPVDQYYARSLHQAGPTSDARLGNRKDGGKLYGVRPPGRTYKSFSANLRPRGWVERFWVGNLKTEDGACKAVDAILHYTGLPHHHYPNTDTDYPPLSLPNESRSLETPHERSEYVKIIAKGDDNKLRRDAFREHVKELVRDIVKELPQIDKVTNLQRLPTRSDEAELRQLPNLDRRYDGSSTASNNNDPTDHDTYSPAAQVQGVAEGVEEVGNDDIEMDEDPDPDEWLALDGWIYKPDTEVNFTRVAGESSSMNCAKDTSALAFPTIAAEDMFGCERPTVFVPEFGIDELFASFISELDPDAIGRGRGVSNSKVLMLRND